MSTRKLQQEFDKTNKKIAEGLSIFDETFDKLLLTDSGSHREKLENDLKKEIKKLQRMRDQLKNWLSDSSIKLDKEILQDNRTKIEHAMDLFKDVEKSSKIKQFSNEGLELQSQKSKYGKFGDDGSKKLEACYYISEVIDRIQQQSEALELGIHQLTLQAKKAKSGNSTSILQTIEDEKYKVERNKNHLTKLEKILRNLENEKLDPDRLDDIKDDIDYYVENNQEEDYVEYDEFYDQVDIEEEIEVQGALTQPPKDSSEIETESDKKPSTETKTPTKNEPKEERTEVRAETPTRKKTVPALNPPALSNYYSNALKSSQQSSPPPQAAAGLNSSTASTPVKFTPPGLSTKSRTSSPSAPSSEPNLTQSANNLQGESFFESIPKMSNLIAARLQSPISYPIIDQYLESSLLNCPDSFDAEVPRQYEAVNIHPSSIDYPQEPMYELNASNIMKRFDNDTLLFCFYYGEGSDNFAKWNAAREMSRRGWIYNTETHQWFSKEQKKSKSPGVDEEDEDSWKYIDYERTWLLRSKDNFKFPEEHRQTF